MTTARSPEIKLGIGNVDESYANELLVAFEYSPTTTTTTMASGGSHKVMLTSLTAQPDRDRPFVINGRQCYAGPAYQRSEEAEDAVVNNMALSVGNLYGLGYRVDKSIKVRFESVPELIAVINAPPTHFDIIDGKEVVVNPMTFNGFGSSTRLSNSEGVTSSFDISRDLVHVSSVAAGASVGRKLVVVAGRVGAQFRKMTKRAEEHGWSTVEQITVSRELVASGDDVVLYMSTTRDLWKFPIVDQSGTQVGSLDVWASSSCGEDCVQKGDGRDLWWFTPDHEPFNVLTYSARAPEDFNPANRIMVGEKVTLGPNEHQQSVSQSTSKSESKVGGEHNSATHDNSGQAGIDINQDAKFMASFLGVGMVFETPNLMALNVEGHGSLDWNDDDEASQTRTAAIERDVSVECYVEPINPEYAYRVQPFVWMARAPDGREYLKVDYTAEPGYYPGASTWWERTYSKPDPTFNLPWWWTTFKRDRTMLTKEMVATPAVPREGDVVEVAVTVRNKALVDARNVNVALWRGSPDNCLDEACLLDDNALIGMATVWLIPAQGKREVVFRFRYDGVQNIHATIDDNDELDEMHEDNNHAYGLLFHDIANSGYTLQTLRLDPAIAVSPVVASDGSGLTIGYQVEATVLGDTFTRANVLVQLWHGGVGDDAGGRLIGTVLVPRVNGSTNATTSYGVSVFWATRNPALYGKQELHAVILHSGFSTEAANVIAHVSQTVSVACYGRVDQCGVCGGNNRTCGGCDGVALSGKTVDACGVCGGNGSTCCIPKPAQAAWHYVRVDDTANGGPSRSWSSLVTRARVGDPVVWENLLDRGVEVVGGAYDYKGAPAVDLSRFNKGHSGLADDLDIDSFLQGHAAAMMMNIKDHVEVAADPSGDRHAPAPDSTTQYLRRRSTASAMSPQVYIEAELYTGWQVTRPAGGAFFEARSEKKRARRSGADNFGGGDDDEKRDEEQQADEAEEEAAAEQFAMGGVCCAQTADDQHGTHDQVWRNQADGRPWFTPQPGGSRSLRSLVVSQLVAQRQQLQRLPSMANSTGTLLTSGMARRATPDMAKAYYNADDGAGDGAAAIRCLCRDKRMFGARGGAGGGDAGGGAGGGGGGGPRLPRLPGGRLQPMNFEALAFPEDLPIDNDRVFGNMLARARRVPVGGAGGGGAGAGAAAGELPTYRPGGRLPPINYEDLPIDNDRVFGAIARARRPAAAAAPAEPVLPPEAEAEAEAVPVPEPPPPTGPYDPDALDTALAAEIDEFVFAADDPEAVQQAEKKFFRSRHHKAHAAMLRRRLRAGIVDDPSVFLDDVNPFNGKKYRDLLPPLPGPAPRSAGQRSGDAEASANNETRRAWPADPGTTERGLRSLSTSGVAQYSTTLVDAVASPGRDGRSVLAPGAASVPHRFFSPGLYLWHDQRNPAIHGVIVVAPSDVAVDACGVCGGDNSTCTDCLGLPGGAARLDACGMCSDPTAAGYTPNPAVDCAGVCHGSAALDECGECTGGTTGRVAGASMDCAGVCGGPARVDCKGVCGGSGRLEWHEGRPSSTLDIDCTGNEGCFQASFNWREAHSCPTAIMDQGLCGCGAAFAVATAATDRACSASQFSPQELLDCLPPPVSGNPCNGEENKVAAKWMGTTGLPTIGCRPYRFASGWDHNPPTCKTNCDAPYASTQKSLTKGISPYRALAASENNVSISVKDLMSEIQTNGPVAANIFLCNNMINFFNTTPTGVYSGSCSRASTDFVGGHVVTIIGWGTAAGGGKYWLFANSWGATWGDHGYGRIARGQDTAGIESWEITAIAMARSPQELRRNAKQQQQHDHQAESQQESHQWQTRSAADIVPGAPVHGSVHSAHAYQAGQAVLESWNVNLASGTTPYQVASINSITYQVVSGVLVTTDLTLTNGVHTVNLVATQVLSSSLGSSVLAITTAAAPVGATAAAVSGTAVVLAALGGAALLVVLSASAVAGTVVYRKHRKAQQTLAQQESDQFSSHTQIEMDMIMQGIQSIKAEPNGTRSKAVSMATATSTTTKAEAEEEEEKPAWRMRIKSITARSPTIIVDNTNTSHQPVPLGAIIAAGRLPQQHNTNDAM